MGYSIGMVFLLSAPPAVAAVPWIMLCSWAADKYRLRAPFVILQCLLGIVGLMIVAYAQNNGARYFGIFMGLAGANANIPTRARMAGQQHPRPESSHVSQAAILSALSLEFLLLI